MFTVHPSPKEFHSEVSLWKRIKYFLSTVLRRNFTREFHSESTSNVFCPRFPEIMSLESFTLKAHQMFSVHTSPKEFALGSFTLKTHEMFPVHPSPKEFHSDVLLWKRSKYFLLTLRRRNFTGEFHSENASNVFCWHFAQGILLGSFTLKTHQMFSVHTSTKKFHSGVPLRKRPKCFLSTLRRRNFTREFYSESASSVFCPHFAEGISLGSLTLKTYQTFSVGTSESPQEFHLGVSLWKRNKWFLSTLRRRNFVWEFHSESAPNVFCPHFAEVISLGRFTLKAHQMFSVHPSPKEFHSGLSFCRVVVSGPFSHNFRKKTHFLSSFYWFIWFCTLLLYFTTLTRKINFKLLKVQRSFVREK